MERLVRKLLKQSQKDLVRIFIFLTFLLTAGCTDKSPGRLQKLLEEVNSTDTGVKNSAILEIGRFGPEGKKAVPKLILVLKTDPSRGIRTSAAFALRSIGTKEAIQALDEYKE